MPSSAASRASASASSGSQPNLRERSLTTPGLRNDTRSSSSGLGAVTPELAHLVRVVGDEDAHAGGQRIADVLVALDRVRVDAAARIDAQPLRQLHLARGGKVQAAAAVQDGCARQPGAAAASARSAGRRRAAPWPGCRYCARTRSQSTMISGEPNLRHQALDLRRARTDPDTAWLGHVDAAAASLKAIRPVRWWSRPPSMADSRSGGAHKPVAHGVPALVARHLLHEDARAAGLVERAQVCVKVVGVGLGALAGVDPGDVLVGLQRQALRQHRDPLAALPTALGSASIRSPAPPASPASPARSAPSVLPGHARR